MGIVKKVMIGLLVALVVIQFVHPTKNADAAITDLHITKMYQVPDSVQLILNKACNDCHSNNTAYPWYSKIQPVDWWLNDHVEEGKEELNLSEFGKRTLAKQAKKLKKLADEVEEGEMPLESYTWMHKDAKLTAAEKQMLITWAKTLADEIAAKAPPETK